MLASRHSNALKNIKTLFEESDYNLSFSLLNAVNYGVPQDRKRVFFIGIRECARIQTFSDKHIFYYSNLIVGYKMVGNAVPCNLAYCLAKDIKNQIQACENANHAVSNDILS